MQWGICKMFFFKKLIIQGDQYINSLKTGCHFTCNSSNIPLAAYCLVILQGIAVERMVPTLLSVFTVRGLDALPREIWHSSSWSPLWQGWLKGPLSPRTAVPVLLCFSKLALCGKAGQAKLVSVTVNGWVATRGLGRAARNPGRKIQQGLI